MQCTKINKSLRYKLQKNLTFFTVNFENRTKADILKSAVRDVLQRDKKEGITVYGWVDTHNLEKEI